MNTAYEILGAKLASPPPWAQPVVVEANPLFPRSRSAFDILSARPVTPAAPPNWVPEYSPVMPLPGETSPPASAYQILGSATPAPLPLPTLPREEEDEDEVLFLRGSEAPPSPIYESHVSPLPQSAYEIFGSHVSEVPPPEPPDIGVIAYELDLGLPLPPVTPPVTPPGATAAATAPNATPVGETVTSSNPAYEAQVAKRIAKSRPMLRRSTRKMEIRDWDLAFGPASAPAGSSILFSANPQCFFRGEKVVATDTGSPQGSGTRIMQVSIGQRIQRPNGGGAQNGAGSLTQFFASTALGNGLLWDTCQPSLTISVLVSFVQACTFDMTVFGRAAF